MSGNVQDTRSMWNSSQYDVWQWRLLQRFEAFLTHVSNIK